MNTLTLLKKEPIKVTAIRWDGTNADKILEWLNPEKFIINISNTRLLALSVYGNFQMEVRLGRWMIRDNGRLYVFKIENLLTHYTCVNPEYQAAPKFECDGYYDFFDHADDGTWLCTERAFKMVDGLLTDVFKDLYFITTHSPEGYEFKVVDKKSTIQQNINGKAMQDFIGWFATSYGYTGV